MTARTRRNARRSLAAACLVWAGMVLGISFLEAWVKFTAPSLTMAVGLDVGRHVFGALNLVEIGWTILTLALVLLAQSHLRNGLLAALAGAWAVVAVQSLWLLPALDARAVRTIAGEAVPDSFHHVLFVVLEVVKVVLLLGVAASLLWKGPAGTPTSATAASNLVENGTDARTKSAIRPRDAR